MNQVKVINTEFLRQKRNDKKNIMGIVNFGKIPYNNNDCDNTSKLDIEIGSQNSECFSEVWISSGKVENIKKGNFNFGIDGENLFGYTSFSYSNTSEKLDKITEKKYIELFQHIRQLNYPYIYRMWNYIPQINNEENIDNYKLFCKGRNNAFNNVYLNSYGIIPAATGIGNYSKDRIGIYFLANKFNKIICLENPRQIPAYKYPDTYGPKPPSFSRATVVLRDKNMFDIYISGTASIIGSESIFPGDPTGQCTTTIENLKILLSKDNLARYDIPFEFTLKDMDYIKIYYRRKCDLTIIKKYCESEFAPNSHISYINADICRKELLVEIEGIIKKL